MMIASDNGGETAASIVKIAAVLVFAAIVCFLARPYMFPDATGQATADVEGTPVAPMPTVIIPTNAPTVAVPAPSGAPILIDMRNPSTSTVPVTPVVPARPTTTTTTTTTTTATPTTTPTPTTTTTATTTATPKKAAKPAQPPPAKPPVPIKADPDDANDDLNQAKQETEGSLN
jgi:hypothetical protein